MTLEELAAKANAAYRGGRLEAGRYWLQAKTQLGKDFRKWALKKAECSIREVERCMELAAAEEREWQQTEPEEGIKSRPTGREDIPTPPGEAEPSAPAEPPQLPSDPPMQAPPGRLLFESYTKLSKQDRELFDVLYADHHSKRKEKLNGAKAKAHGGLGAAYSGNVTPLFQRGEGAD